MKSIIQENSKLTVLALILVLPTAYFICISVLKYEMGVDAPFDTIAPLLERMGIRQTVGWNINLLILLGPVIAFVLAILQVLKIDRQFTKEQFDFHFTLRKRWFPLLVVAFSLCVLAILAIYLVGENLVIRE